MHMQQMLDWFAIHCTVTKTKPLLKLPGIVMSADMPETAWVCLLKQQLLTAMLNSIDWPIVAREALPVCTSVTNQEYPFASAFRLRPCCVYGYQLGPDVQWENVVTIKDSEVAAFVVYCG